MIAFYYSNMLWINVCKKCFTQTYQKNKKGAVKKLDFKCLGACWNSVKTSCQSTVKCLFSSHSNVMVSGKFFYLYLISIYKLRFSCSILKSLAIYVLKIMWLISLLHRKIEYIGSDLISQPNLCSILLLLKT